MIDKDKQNEIFESANEFRDYFKDDEVALDDLLNKLNELQNISNDQITTMVNAAPGRGVQHNLIEHMTNAISLASQFQSVLKDKRSIKERSLDLALKNSKEENETTDMEDIILNMQKLMKEKREESEKKIEKLDEKIQSSNDDLDKKIEEKLGLN